MPVKAVVTKQETPFEKDKRLKARKQIYKETYRKGIFLWNKETTKSWIDQDDVAIRAIDSGTLDDGKQFVTIRIEGFLEDGKSQY